MNPKQLATMSEHVANIRSLADNIHDFGQTSDEHTDKLLTAIKVECHILREHLKDMMPFLTDEVIT